MWSRPVVAFLLALVLVAGPAGAATTTTTPQQRQSQIDKELARLRQQVAEISDQQAGLIAELNVSRTTRKQLDLELAKAQADMDAVQAELDRALAAEQAASRSVDEAAAKLRDSTGVLRDQAIEAYIHFGESPSLDQALAEVKSLNDAPRVAVFVQTLAERQAAVVDEHKQLSQDMTRLQADAAAARADVAKRREDLGARRQALEEARDQAASEAANEQQVLAKANEQKSAYLRQINELERESSDIAAQLANRQAGQTAPPPSPGLVGYPVANPVVTSPFGYRIHPIYGDRRLHSGVDFSATTGMPIFAAKDGTVVTAGYQSGYGNVVVIDHGGALATLYGHNSQLLVKAGDVVKRGQRIALAGSTGNSTGPHGHFEVRIHGTPVDPMNYL